MLKKISIGFMLFILLALLVSCEGATDYYYYISNESNETIHLSGNLTKDYDGEGALEFDVEIENGGRHLVYRSHSRGGDSFVDPSPFKMIEKLVIITESNDTLEINHLDNKNVESSIDEISKNPSEYEQKYFLIVK